MTEIVEMHGKQVMLVASDGPPLARERDAVDIVGEAFTAHPHLIAIPVARLSPDFFKLKTRLAGDMLQKFMNYGYNVAIVGDIAHDIAESEPLRDFVRECNRGKQVWFVNSLDELSTRLDN
jgi:hypothetical protein